MRSCRSSSCPGEALTGIVGEYGLGQVEENSYSQMREVTEERPGQRTRGRES